MTKHKKPLNRTIGIASIVFLIIICASLSITNIALHTNFIYNDYETYIKDILNYTMSHIDADDLKVCIETEEESEKYKETLLFMDDIMNHYGDIHYFYAILPLNTEETGNTMSVLSAERYHDRYEDTEGNLYLGWVSDDEYDSETAKLMMDIMNGSEIVFFKETTEWGIDYTGAAPIKDSKGKGIAVLCVDIDITFIRSSILKYALINISITAVFGLAFISIFFIWFRKYIIDPLKKLEKSAVNFVDRSSDNRDINNFEFESVYVKPDNEIKSLSDAVETMTVDMKKYVSDIISAEEKVRYMRELANHDALTGVRNKTAYDAAINSITEKKYGIAIIDLNNLKTINDTYGHDKGNIAIIKLANMVCETFSRSPVFRIGGDEFAVILLKSDYDNYYEHKEELEVQFKELVENPNLEPWDKVTAAIGAAFHEEGEDNNSLFERADQEMYKRKKEMNQPLKGQN